MIKNIKNLVISGVECLPIVEGGKGIGFSNYLTAGSFAKTGAVGTMSGVNPDIIGENGEIIPMRLTSKNRFERHVEMIKHSVEAIISQAKRARDISGGKGRIHMNVLWEMGGTETILNEALGRVKGLINGVICGAGMPYKLGEIAAKYKVYYYPIVSSMRAFRALWIRSFEKTKDWLGAVVYECPWKAGGHNGLSNSEDPNVCESAYDRVREIRKYMNEIGLQDTPIIMAGGVWNIEEYEDWIDNPEIGKIAFQFGTRPMIVQESPVPQEAQQILRNLKESDVITNRFSPTGFYSSAVNNELLQELYGRLSREIKYSTMATVDFPAKITVGKTNKEYFIKENEVDAVNSWAKDGFSEALKTPDETIVFVTTETSEQIKEDLKDCHGCLSQCRFSSWSQRHPENNYNTGILPDPRSFCIQKSLQFAKLGINKSRQLLFAGSNAFRFATDPFYRDGFVPTIKQLVDRIMEGK